MTALIVTTAHWSGDPRLNRHAAYLEAAGISTRLVALESTGLAGRLASVFKAARTVHRERPDFVILADPELFVVVSIWARLIGVSAVIDIHEDYQKAAMARLWVPRWLRAGVAFLAGLNDRLGRRVADTTVVAAPELASKHSRTVLNIPDPASFKAGLAHRQSRTIVYVGDVTEPRGALDIAKLARRLPELTFLVIGRCATALADEMKAVAGPHARLELVGQKAHGEAWGMARGSIAGLSLLHPVPAYQEAVATKLWEYCAAAIPPVVTDLPGQRGFVSRIDESLAVSDEESLQAVITRLTEDEDWRSSIAAKSRALVESEWQAHRPDLELVAAVIPDR
jgi:hypothetical protein